MIAYMTELGKYFPPDSKHNVLYMNITNACNNNCVFCLRDLKDSPLWLEHEPTLDEIFAALQQVDFSNIEEIVFCGFGEPTCRLEVLLSTLRHIKSSFAVKTRLNTNGLANLQYSRDVTPLFDGLLDRASISLNAPSAEKYLALTRSPFGLQSFPALLDFAQKLNRFCSVSLTCVDKTLPPADIAACQELCQNLNLHFRLRPFEDS